MDDNDSSIHPRGAVYTVRSAEGYRHRVGTLSPTEARRYIKRYVVAARAYAAAQRD